MQRILRGAQATVTLTITVDGDPTNADAPPTVTVFREDGTELESGAAVATGLTGEYAYVLTPAELDVLTFEWAADIGGVAQTFRTYAEVVGAFLFSITAARKLDALKDETEYPDARIVEGRTDAERTLDDECRVALVPRYDRAVLSGDGSRELFLPRPQAHRIIAATVGGVELTADELAAIDVDADEGVAWREARWPKGERNIEVRYAHGFEVAPGRAGFAALKLARYMLVDSPIDDRALSVTNPDGSVETFTVAGRRGAVFAVPEANALVRGLRHVYG